MKKLYDASENTPPHAVEQAVAGTELSQDNVARLGRLSFTDWAAVTEARNGDAKQKAAFNQFQDEFSGALGYDSY